MTENANPKKAQGEKYRGADKVSRIPIKIEPTTAETKLKKPHWIRATYSGNSDVTHLKEILRENRLVTVCEEAACPNLGECFSHGTATFMIMGDICTRRCPFCDVGHGRPNPLDIQEPETMANTISKMRLKYVVITSVDRDDLRDGGAEHFAQCIEKTYALNPNIQIEILTPDFRGRQEIALEILSKTPPNVFNHNLETVPRLYKQARPGADYQQSLNLLRDFKMRCPDVPTKSGLMVGLGETNEEILEVMQDMRAHNINMLTIGQYLQPSPYHLPVMRYVTPDEFLMFKEKALAMGFTQVASAPMVRSSYHADLQAKGLL